MIPVILSGGAGTRLWPLSRQQRPKQFLPVVEENTLFQSTIQRLENVEGMDAPLVVCNEDHRFMVAEQLRQAGFDHQGILLEPVGRNTAPAITLAALYLQKNCSEDDVMLVLPADHVIKDTHAFEIALKGAQQAANAGYLVTFGIVPDKPETGYGYIRKGGQITNLAAAKVSAFVEKPDQDRAGEYLTNGGYLWNSGMFMFRVDCFLDEMQQQAPEIVKCCCAALAKQGLDLDFTRIGVSSFEACPSISIDYALMEKTSRAAVVPLDAGWSDVGAWSAVWETGEQDEAGNVSRGDVITCQSSNNLVYSEKRLVSLLGVDNLVVVDTRDATLVAAKNQVQEVKSIVEQLEKQGRSEATEHREVNRPWGCYDSIDAGNRFQVKRITVKPGARLSLQKHHHRAEHWIVVKGTAEVTCDDKTFLLTENQSTYIPLGSTHRLSNPGKLPLELIEVQSGSYLGEDDIVRLDDHYGRSDSDDKQDMT